VHECTSGTGSGHLLWASSSVTARVARFVGRRFQAAASSPPIELFEPFRLADVARGRRGARQDAIGRSRRATRVGWFAREPTPARLVGRQSPASSSSTCRLSAAAAAAAAQSNCRLDKLIE
jgi:hypothetical protein